MIVFLLEPEEVSLGPLNICDSCRARTLCGSCGDTPLGVVDFVGQILLIAIAVSHGLGLLFGSIRHVVTQQITIKRLCCTVI